MITIKITEREDLLNVQRLWASPDVMHFVGFPEGLHRTLEQLEQWVKRIQNPPHRLHYSIYDGAVYCGETFYDVDETGLASMDIKLLPSAREKGIANFVLSYALDQAFLMGGATRAWVDPHRENASSQKLYDRLGFRQANRPAHLDEPGDIYIYMELSWEDWQAKRGIRYKSIILRDMVEADIVDEIRWNTIETAWMDWDGPDLQSDDPFDEGVCRAECMELLNKPKESFRRSFELDTDDGLHIGTVSCYPTGADFGHMKWKEAEIRGQFWYTLGIVICEKAYWSNGYGTQALTAFCKHFLNHGKTNLRVRQYPHGSLRRKGGICGMQPFHRQPLHPGRRL